MCIECILRISVALLSGGHLGQHLNLHAGHPLTQAIPAFLFLGGNSVSITGCNGGSGHPKSVSQLLAFVFGALSLLQCSSLIPDSGRITNKAQNKPPVCGLFASTTNSDVQGAFPKNQNTDSLKRRNQGSEWCEENAKNRQI